MANCTLRLSLRAEARGQSLNLIVSLIGSVSIILLALGFVWIGSLLFYKELALNLDFFQEGMN